MSYRRRCGRTNLKPRNSKGSVGETKHACVQCIVCPTQKPCFIKLISVSEKMREKETDLLLSHKILMNKEIETSLISHPYI